MPPTCRACRSPQRAEIDAGLLAGDSSRALAGRVGLTKSSLDRHRPHIGKALARAAERKGERLDGSLLEKVERLEADARRLGERAESEGDLRAALVAVDKLMDVVKLLREMTAGAPSETTIVLSWSDSAPGAAAPLLPAVPGETES